MAHSGGPGVQPHLLFGVPLQGCLGSIPCGPVEPPAEVPADEASWPPLRACWDPQDLPGPWSSSWATELGALRSWESQAKQDKPGRLTWGRNLDSITFSGGFQGITKPCLWACFCCAGTSRGPDALRSGWAGLREVGAEQESQPPSSGACPRLPAGRHTAASERAVPEILPFPLGMPSNPHSTTPGKRLCPPWPQSLLCQ